MAGDDQYAHSRRGSDDCRMPSNPDVLAFRPHAPRDLLTGSTRAAGITPAGSDCATGRLDPMQQNRDFYALLFAERRGRKVPNYCEPARSIL